MTTVNKVEFQAVPENGHPFVCTVLYGSDNLNKGLKAAFHSQILGQFNTRRIIEDKPVCPNTRDDIDDYSIQMRSNQPGFHMYPTCIKLINEHNEIIHEYRAQISTNGPMNPTDQAFALQEIIITVGSETNPSGFASVDF